MGYLPVAARGRRGGGRVGEGGRRGGVGAARDMGRRGAAKDVEAIGLTALPADCLLPPAGLIL